MVPQTSTDAMPDSADGPQQGPVPEIGQVDSEALRAYRQHGSLWEGASRVFHSPHVRLVAQHAGMLPVLADVRSVDRTIRMADVQAYMTAHGIATPDIPPLLPSLTAAEAAAYVDILIAHDMYMLALESELKKPSQFAWNEAPALTRDEAIAQYASGGNVGWDVGRSRKVVVDCEDSRSTRAMIAAGYHPDVATANGLDPTSPKYGGRHFIFDVPDGVTDAQLRSKLGRALGGGKVDILAAPFDEQEQETRTVAGVQVVVNRHSRFAVAPGSQLFEARSGRYGVHQEFAEGKTNGPAPLWLWGQGEPPAPVAELAGVLVQAPKRAYVPDPRSDRITQAVDGIDWEIWMLYCQGKLSFYGFDGSCGCGVYTYVDATSGPRSVILHEGCGHGWGAHSFSGSLAAAWGRDHGSRLQLAAFLSGRSERDLARELGIDLRRNPLRGFTLSDLGVTPITANATDSDEDVVVAAAAEGTGAWVQVEIARIEAETRCWERVTFMRDIDDAAASHGVLNWGLLAACLPRLAMHIPAHVRLVGSAGQEGGPSSGAAVSIISLPLGAPEAGKSEVIKIAADLIPLPAGAELTASGTGEGVMKTFGSMVPSGDAKETDDSGAGEDELDRFAARNKAFRWQRNTDRVLLETAEGELFMTEMNRTGTKAMALFRSMWMGEVVGTTTSDIKRRTFMNAHTYRFCGVIGAQLDLAALGPLLEGGRLGNPQRFLPLPVGVTEAVGSPRQTIEVPPIAYDEHPVAAGMVELMDGQRPPVFIHWPPAARAEFTAARQRRQADTYAAFDVERVLLQAEIDDPLEDMRGHELLHQLKIAAVLARRDGLIDPTDAHWYVAGAVMQVRAVVLRATVLVLEACKKVERIRTGRDRGEVSGHSKIAEATTQDEFRGEVATKVAARLAEEGRPLSQTQIARPLSRTQQGVVPEVLAYLVDAKTVAVAGVNRNGNTLYALAGLAVAPVIGTVGA